MAENIKLNSKYIVLFFLILGVALRLIWNGNGNFIFHMDPGRDMVDVREMVILHKPRLIGPTSAIVGLYNGPGWYYLLAIPFILSGGDPYAEIIMEVVLWTIGGYFLLKLTEKFGSLSMVTAGILWTFSNYITLLTAYSFNPNPVALLTPALIYFVTEYLKNSKIIHSVLIWILAGLFFNFEMNAGVFVPLEILLVFLIVKRKVIFKLKSFWLGIFVFLLFLLPQIIFDLKHNLIMYHSVLNFIKTSSSSSTIFLKTNDMLNTYFNVLSSVFLNHQFFTYIMIFSSLVLLFLKRKIIFQNPILIFSYISITLSFLIYCLTPVTVNSWHLGIIVVSSIILCSWIVSIFNSYLKFILIFSLALLALNNQLNFFQNEFGKKSSDQSAYINEVSAIDYVYQKAGGKTFRVYSFLPSVYDYPYQYLFWWYGNKKYGFIPKEYTYSPNKPEYVPSQSMFQEKKNIPDSNLVFLIEEPQDPKLLDLWLNTFRSYPKVEEDKVGPLTIETRLFPQSFLGAGENFTR